MNGKFWDDLIRGIDPQKANRTTAFAGEKYMWKCPNQDASENPPEDLRWEHDYILRGEGPDEEKTDILSAKITYRVSEFRAELASGGLTSSPTTGKPGLDSFHVHVKMLWDHKLVSEKHKFRWDNVRTYTMNNVDLETAIAFAESKRQEFIELVKEEEKAS